MIIVVDHLAIQAITTFIHIDLTGRCDGLDRATTVAKLTRTTTFFSTLEWI